MLKILWKIGQTGKMQNKTVGQPLVGCQSIISMARDKLSEPEAL